MVLSGSSRRRSPLTALAVLLVLALAAVALGYGAWRLFRGPPGGGESGSGTPPPPVGTDQAGATPPPTAGNPRPTSGALPLPAAAESVPGEDLLRRGRPAEAAEKLEAFLKSAPPPAPPAAERARYLLACACEALGQKEKCRQLLTQSLGTPYGGEAGLVLGRMAAAEGQSAEAERCFTQAWEKFPASRSGRLAARLLADRLYDAAVVKSEDRTRWERLWRLYSAALPTASASERPELVLRLGKLAGYVLFNHGYVSPAAETSGIASYYVVQPGEVLEKIAKKLNLSTGLLREANGIPRTGAGADLIGVNQRLKVLRGELSLLAERSSHRLTLLIDGGWYREYVAGFGRPEEPTPLGEYVVENKTTNPAWRGIPFGDAKNPLGTRWIGFADRPQAAGIGIHGSNPDGDGVPGNKSLGCIRLRNKDVEEIYELIRFDPQGVNGTRATIIE